jgi:hypothetical protein
MKRSLSTPVVRSDRQVELEKAINDPAADAGHVPVSSSWSAASATRCGTVSILTSFPTNRTLDGCQPTQVVLLDGGPTTHRSCAALGTNPAETVVM